jgi:hypothetical protein
MRKHKTHYQNTVNVVFCRVSILLPHDPLANWDLLFASVPRQQGRVFLFASLGKIEIQSTVSTVMHVTFPSL